MKRSIKSLLALTAAVAVGSGTQCHQRAAPSQRAMHKMRTQSSDYRRACDHRRAKQLRKRQVNVCEVDRQVMGRHAGWIALHSGMAGGASVRISVSRASAPAASGASTLAARLSSSAVAAVNRSPLRLMKVVFPDPFGPARRTRVGITTIHIRGWL